MPSLPWPSRDKGSGQRPSVSSEPGSQIVAVSPVVDSLLQSVQDSPTSVVAVLGERSSGKSLLSNLICRQPAFALEANSNGILYATKPLRFAELAGLYGLHADDAAASPAVLFAEFGSDRRMEAEHLLPLLRVATTVVLNVYAGADPYTWLHQWFAFVPILSQLMKERGHVQLGELLVVVRDTPENVVPDDLTAQLWNFEPMPLTAGSDEEHRNVIRFHVQKIFKSIRMHYLPFPVHKAALLKSRVFQTKNLTPEFWKRFSEFAASLVERLRTPHQLDDGETVTGKTIRHIASAPTPSTIGEDGITMEQRQPMLLQKACESLHEEHAMINHRRHLKHLKELVDYHLAPPVKPESLDEAFAALVEQVLGLLRGVFHESTPDAVRQKLEHNMREAAAPILEKHRAVNNTYIQDSILKLVAESVTEVQKNVDALHLPCPKEKLANQIQERLNQSVKNCMEQASLEQILNESQQSSVVMEVRAGMENQFAALAERNETRSEELLQTEREAVLQNCTAHFFEMQKQARDHPFTNRELIHTVSTWIDSMMFSLRQKLAGQIEESRVDVLCRQLSLDLRQLSSSCVVANLESANGKINNEVDDCLSFYRHQVLQPQIQACIVNVAAQTREIMELERVLATTPQRLLHVKSLKAPQDLLVPFRSQRFLERTFIHALMERAEFLCSVSDLTPIFQRQREQQRLQAEQAAAAERAHQDLPYLPMTAVDEDGPLGSLKGGQAAQRQNSKVVAWSRVPAGVPYLEGAGSDPSPAQVAMDALLTHAENKGDVGPPDSMSTALALPGLGPRVPETLAQFKVLTAEIIDHICASLRQMADEDTADLIRRQRQRDDRWRQLVMLKPSLSCSQSCAALFTNDLGNGEAGTPKRGSDKHHQTNPSQDPQQEPLQLGGAVAAFKRQLEEERHRAEEAQRKEEIVRREADARAQQQGEITHQLESEVTRLRELLGRQQSTLAAQQEALTRAARAHEEERNEKALALQCAEQAKQVASQEADARKAEQIAAEKARMEAAAAVSRAEEASEALKSMDPDKLPEDSLQQLLKNEVVKEKFISLLEMQRMKQGKRGSTRASLVANEVAPVVLTGRPDENVPDASYAQRSKKGGAPAMRMCGRCKQPFNVSKNNSRACRYHKGRWAVAPGKGKNKLFVNAAMALVMGPQDRYKVQEDGKEIGRWTCCGSREKDDPGCVTDSHVAADSFK